MNKKIVISQKNVWKVLFFFCAIVALNVPGSIFYNDYSENLIVIFGVIEIAITGLICIKSSKLNSLLATGIAEFVTPFFVVTVVSCVSAAVIHQTSNVGDITQSFIRAIQIAAVFIIAYNAVKKFGNIFRYIIDRGMYFICDSYFACYKWRIGCLTFRITWIY